MNIVSDTENEIDEMLRVCKNNGRSIRKVYNMIIANIATESNAYKIARKVSNHMSVGLALKLIDVFDVDNVLIGSGVPTRREAATENMEKLCLEFDCETILTNRQVLTKIFYIRPITKSMIVHMKLNIKKLHTLIDATAPYMISCLLHKLVSVDEVYDLIRQRENRNDILKSLIRRCSSDCVSELPGLLYIPEYLMEDVIEKCMPCLITELLNFIDIEKNKKLLNLLIRRCDGGFIYIIDNDISKKGIEIDDDMKCHIFCKCNENMRHLLKVGKNIPCRVRTLDQ